MSHEDNSEETTGNGRRSTDNTSIEGVFSPSSGVFRSKLFSGFFSLGVVTALITVGISAGNFSATMDMAIKSIDENKLSIKEILTQNRDLIIVLREQNVQQKAYEEKILDKLNDTEDKLNDINNGVRGNREAIIIMNGKVTIRDNTRVQYLAGR